MRRFIDYLATLPKWQVLGTAIILVSFFGVIDYVTGPDLSIFVLYLIPVFLGTWFIGNRAGILLSILSALAWSLADRIYADAIIPYWNLSVEVCSFLVIAYILSVLKQSLDNEKQLATTNDLTGTFNRRHFIELADWTSTISRLSMIPWGIMPIPLDIMPETAFFVDWQTPSDRTPVRQISLPGWAAMNSLFCSLKPDSILHDQLWKRSRTGLPRSSGASLAGNVQRRRGYLRGTARIS